MLAEILLSEAEMEGFFLSLFFFLEESAQRLLVALYSQTFREF